MKERLERSGIRSISAVVDVTNYVMLELGQPLHAYDDRLLEGAIVVRFARAGEKLTLLNGQMLDLEPDLLLVCDEKKPLGLAGIMGGEHSGISDTTTTVLLEGAFWNPAVIQGRSRRLGFASDAGYRFERGVDFGNCARAVERATQLILDICGGRAGPLGDVTGALPRARRRCACAPRASRGSSASTSPTTTIAHTVRPARTRVHARRATISSSRRRRTGSTSRSRRTSSRKSRGSSATTRFRRRRRAHVQAMLPDPETASSAVGLKRRLVARDWQEAITFSFVSSACEAALFPDRDRNGGADRRAEPDREPSRRDAHDARRRPDRRAADQPRAQARARPRVRGRALLPARRPSGCDQPLRIGGLAYGDAVPEQWGIAKRPVDFFDVKGDLEALVAPRDAHHRRAAPIRCCIPAARRACWLDGASVGWLGELHPRLAKALRAAAGAGALRARPRPAARAGPSRRARRCRSCRSSAATLPWSSTRPSPPQDRAGRPGGRRSPRACRAIRLFDVYRGPGIAARQKKPCDSGAYAGY